MALEVNYLSRSLAYLDSKVTGTHSLVGFVSASAGEGSPCLSISVFLYILPRRQRLSINNHIRTLLPLPLTLRNLFSVVVFHV